MKLTTVLLLSLVCCSQTVMAQKKLPVIKASSTQVDIKDDGDLQKNAWRIEPETNPDVYTTSAKKVTFYTDIDSISFNVDPKIGTYDFVILLNGKDSARTQVKYQPSRLDMLKKADKYNYADNRSVPPFTYQPAEHPALVKIRTDLKLDSIAGKGSELSQVDR